MEEYYFNGMIICKFIIYVTAPMEMVFPILTMTTLCDE